MSYDASARLSTSMLNQSSSTSHHRDAEIHQISQAMQHIKPFTSSYTASSTSAAAAASAASAPSTAPPAASASSTAPHAGLSSSAYTHAEPQPRPVPQPYAHPNVSSHSPFRASASMMHRASLSPRASLGGSSFNASHSYAGMGELFPPSSNSRAVLSALKALQARVSALKAENEELRSLLDQQKISQGERQQLEAHYEALLAKAHAALKQMKVSHEAKLDGVGRAREMVHEELEEVKSKNSSLREQLASARQEAADTRELHDQLEEQLRRSERERESLQMRLSEMHQTLSSELIAASSRTAKLETENEDLRRLTRGGGVQQLVTELQQEVRLLRQQKEMLETRVRASTSKPKKKKKKSTKRAAKKGPPARRGRSLTRPTASSRAKTRKAKGEGRVKHERFGYALPFTVGSTNTSHSVPVNVQEILAKQPIYVPAKTTKKRKKRKPVRHSHMEISTKPDPVTHSSQLYVSTIEPLDADDRAEDKADASSYPVGQSLMSLSGFQPHLDMHGEESAMHTPREDSSMTKSKRKKKNKKSTATEVRTVDTIIKRLQAEIGKLNRRYSELLDEGKSSVLTVDDSSEVHAKLRGILSEIDLKNQQLDILRQHKVFLQSDSRLAPPGNKHRSSSLHSPEARRIHEKKIKSLRLLGEFRKLFDEHD